ncbi:TM2 domain-containing protein [Agromyces sp. Marseille-Q5079]|uniref:TM2 domain-containing protein n=1 Tax=Agromyces sp. Marseille-Q5079 TaxID=3439059 RepID=UPI003D9C91E6
MSDPTLPPSPNVPPAPPAPPVSAVPPQPYGGAPAPAAPSAYGVAPAAPAPYGAPPAYGAPLAAPAPYGAAPYGAAPYGAPQPYAAPAAPVGEKSFVATWLLAWFLGLWGVDRFYLGKVGTGLAKLLTFGGLGVWVLIDLILVLTGSQRDQRGQRLAGYDEHKKIAWIVTGAVIALGLVVNIVNGAVSGASGALEAVDQPAIVVEADAAADDSADTAELAADSGAVATAQTWADDTFGSFAPVTQTGAGDALITLPGTSGIVTATHDGSANFVVNVLDATNGSTGELLVNTIGAYTGTTAYGFSSFSEPATLQITADGNWTITIAPVSAAPALASSGSGDGVFLYDGGAAALTATHSGEANFVITEEAPDSLGLGLLVNEIGNYSGTVPLSAGPSAIAVQADGSWTLAVG